MAGVSMAGAPSAAPSRAVWRRVPGWQGVGGALLGLVALMVRVDEVIDEAGGWPLE